MRELIWKFGLSDNLLPTVSVGSLPLPRDGLARRSDPRCSPALLHHCLHAHVIHCINAVNGCHFQSIVNTTACMEVRWLCSHNQTAYFHAGTCVNDRPEAAPIYGNDCHPWTEGPWTDTIWSNPVGGQLGPTRDRTEQRKLFSTHVTDDIWTIRLDEFPRCDI